MTNEDITEKYNANAKLWSNCLVYKTILTSKLRRHKSGGSGKTEGRACSMSEDWRWAKIIEFAIRLCHLEISEAILTNSDQHDCLNKDNNIDKSM